MLCGNCGHEVPLSSEKCPHCGASAAQQEYFHAPARKETAPQAKQPSQTRRPGAPVRGNVPPQRSSPSKKTAVKPHSPAEKTEVSQKRPPRSKVLVVFLTFWGILAVGMFSIQLSFYSSPDRYLESGEAFVQALITQDDATLSRYIHSSMRGSLRPLGYDTVEACEVHGRVAEDVDAEALSQELSEQYGLQKSVASACWILVEYTVKGNGQTVSCSMEVLMANIGGDLYAVKTRNLIDSTTASPDPM